MRSNDWCAHHTFGMVFKRCPIIIACGSFDTFTDLSVILKCVAFHTHTYTKFRPDAEFADKFYIKTNVKQKKH